MVKQEKHLGVTTAAGRYRRVGAISKRAVKFAARRDRVARVRQAGGPANKVVRHAKVPSLLYGVKVMGMHVASDGFTTAAVKAREAAMLSAFNLCKD